MDNREKFKVIKSNLCLFIYGYIFILLTASISNAYASSCVSEIINTVQSGHPIGQFRFRYENKKQQSLLDSNAFTLRSALGWETNKFKKSFITIELLDVASMFGQHYNPGPGNYFSSKSQYSIIADAPGAGLTQGKITTEIIPNNSISIGRRYISFDNQRFVGKNNWRQYPQSFDAISIENITVPNLTFFYAYVAQVETSYGNNQGIPNFRHSLKTQFIHAEYDAWKYAKLVGYIYLNKDMTITTNSNSTYGLRLVGSTTLSSQINFGYLLESALQFGCMGNPSYYAAHYEHARFSANYNIITALFGFELLSGNAYAQNKNLITPFASIHNLNGYAGVFDTLPSQGLHDLYATILIEKKKIKLETTFHYFLLDKSVTSKRAGQELDIALYYQFNRFHIEVGYANYIRSYYNTPSTLDCWLMLTYFPF